jgi:hypothetical protein
MTINLQIQTQNPHAKPDCVLMATFVSLQEESSYIFNVLMMFNSTSKGTPRKFFTFYWENVGCLADCCLNGLCKRQAVMES